MWAYVYMFWNSDFVQGPSLQFKRPTATTVDAIYAISNNSRCHLCHFQQQSIPFIPFPTTVDAISNTVDAIYAISNNSYAIYAVSNNS